MPEPRRARALDSIVFSILAGVLSPLLHGYRFGFGNQISELPIVLRAIDPGWLAGDFYTDASAAFGPRFYYAWLLARLASLAPLEWIVLALTCAASAGIVLSACMAALRVSGGSPLAAFTAGALVTSVSAIEFGGSGRLFRGDLTASHLATPLALFSLWAGIARRPLLCGALGGAAALIHPAIGLEHGVLGLAACGAGLLWGHRGRRGPDEGAARALEGAGAGSRSGRGVALDGAGIVAARDGGRGGAAMGAAGAWLTGAAILGAVVAIAWWLPGGAGPAGAGWVEIESRLRHPHHAIASAFPLRDHLLLLAFLAALVLCWRHHMGGRPVDRELLLRILVPVGVILVAFAAGYAFTEIFPSGLWASLRVYRLAGVIKWIGLILLAVTAAEWMQGEKRGRGPFAWILVAGCGIAQPLIALIGALGGILHGRASRSRLGGRLTLAACWIATAALLARFGSIEEALLLLVLLAFAFLLASGRSGPLRLGIPATATALIVAAALAARAGLPVPLLDPPVISPDDGPALPAAAFARDATPPGSVFVTPPGLGRFRLEAERPIVVDFKAFPFGPEAMVEWRARLVDLFGEPSGIGFEAEREMDRRYRGITDGDLVAAGARYGASFAVLYRETPTGLPSLHEDAIHRVVALPR